VPCITLRRLATGVMHEALRNALKAAVQWLLVTGSFCDGMQLRAHVAALDEGSHVI